MDKFLIILISLIIFILCKNTKETFTDDCNCKTIKEKLEKKVNELDLKFEELEIRKHYHEWMES